MRKITLFILTVCCHFVFASDNSIHMHALIQSINNSSFDKALNEMQSVSNWSYDESMPKIELTSINLFLSQISFFHRSNDSIWQSHHFDSLLIYFSHEFDTQIKKDIENYEYKRACDNAQCLLVYVKSILGESHPFYIHILEYLPSLFLAYRQPIEAGRVYSQYIGTWYENQGDINRAISAYEQARPFIEMLHDGKSEEYAVLLTKLAQLYNIKGEWRKSTPCISQAHEIVKTIYSDKNAHYILFLYKAGIMYKEAGILDTAEVYLKKVLHNIEKNIDENWQMMSICHSILGEIYVTQGKYAEAQNEFKVGIQIIQSKTSSPVYELGLLYHRYGNYYSRVGDLINAIENYKNAEAILEKTQPNWELSDERALFLVNKAQVYSNIGIGTEAKKDCEEALRIMSFLQMEKSPLYANCLMNLSDVYLKRDDRAKADELAQEAYQIQNDILPPNHPHVPAYLQRMALLYREISIKKAKEYILRALDIQRNISDSTIEYAMFMINAADIYNDLDQVDSAIITINQALPILEKHLKEDSPYVVYALNSVGDIYAHQENNDSLLQIAEYFYEYAIDIMDSMDLPQPELYSGLYNNLAVLYYKRHQYEYALVCHLIALDSIKQIATPKSERYALSLIHLGDTYYRLRKYDEAEKYLRKGTEIIMDIFTSTCDYMPEEIRESFWENSLSYLFLHIASLVYANHRQKPILTEWAYDTELFSKGALVNSQEFVKQSILNSGDSVLKQQWEDLVELKNELMYLQEHSTTPEELKIYTNKTDSLERIVTKNSAIYRDRNKWRTVTWKDVQKALTSKDVAIEFQYVPVAQDTVIFSALVLRKRDKHPIFVPLFEMRDLSQYFYETNRGDLSYLGNENEISHLIWDNILPYLNPGENIYFAPSGVMHQIAIENLPYDSNRTMSDVFHMIRLSSTREIVLRHSKSSMRSVVLYGGIEYDADINHLADNEIRGEMIDTLNRSYFSYLKGSEKEVIQIDSIIHKGKNITSALYTSAEASEASFKALSGKDIHVVHIATHGFYWSESIARTQKYYATNSLSSDPLRRSGLLFSGANMAMLCGIKNLQDSVQDGVLTAKEISTLNFNKTELVVLSACNTGLGEITGDGVYGLQRAFKIAGAQTIIMSLWPVNDEATQLIMTEFYRNLIWKGQSKRDAFHNAQNSVRNREQYKEPKYWAGFVMLD